MHTYGCSAIMLFTLKLHNYLQFIDTLASKLVLIISIAASIFLILEMKENSKCLRWKYIYMYRERERERERECVCIGLKMIQLKW